MAAILSLRPNVSRDEAVACFRGAGVSGMLSSVVVGPLRSVADVYLPFRLYRVNTRNGRRSQTELLALDAVRGSFDLYRFDRIPAAGELAELETVNHAPAFLEEAGAQALVIERVRRLVFGSGFWRIRGLEIEAEQAAVFYVPYWVGFSGRGEKASLAVLDAVRRRPEGSKVRTFIREWLIGAA